MAIFNALNNPQYQIGRLISNNLEVMSGFTKETQPTLRGNQAITKDMFSSFVLKSSEFTDFSRGTTNLAHEIPEPFPSHQGTNVS